MALIHAGISTLELGDGGSPLETFTVLGGVERFALTLVASLRQAQTVADGPWQRAQAQPGRVARLEASGLVNDSATEQRLRDAALSGTPTRIRLTNAVGAVLTAPMLVERYTLSQEQEDVQRYAVVLTGAGAVGVG